MVQIPHVTVLDWPSLPNRSERILFFGPDYFPHVPKLCILPRAHAEGRCEGISGAFDWHSRPSIVTPSICACCDTRFWAWNFVVCAWNFVGFIEIPEQGSFLKYEWISRHACFVCAVLVWGQGCDVGREPEPRAHARGAPAPGELNSESKRARARSSCARRAE